MKAIIIQTWQVEVDSESEADQLVEAMDRTSREALPLEMTFAEVPEQQEIIKFLGTRVFC